jgi:hypothetical protein
VGVYNCVKHVLAEKTKTTSLEGIVCSAGVHPVVFYAHCMTLVPFPIPKFIPPTPPPLPPPDGFVCTQETFFLFAAALSSQF